MSAERTITLRCDRKGCLKEHGPLAYPLHSAGAVRKSAARSGWLVNLPGVGAAWRERHDYCPLHRNDRHVDDGAGEGA